jgi:hypothetical protein
MSDDEELYPVYQCSPGEEDADPAFFKIGVAPDKRKAAKIIREATGDPDYRSGDVYFSWPRKAFYAEG